MIPPRCYDCLSEDVSVRVIDDMGFEHWFCAADWAAQQAFHDRITDLFGKALAALERIAT